MSVAPEPRPHEYGIVILHVRAAPSLCPTQYDDRERYSDGPSKYRRSRR